VSILANSLHNPDFIHLW